MSDTEIAVPISDRFMIRERLGSGGMGVVYAAYDRERDEMVALKTLHHRNASSLYAFKKEFRNLADVAHPNLVSLYELIAEDERWFFTMELIDGVDFIDYIRPSVEGMLRPTPATHSVLTETLPLDEPMGVVSATPEPQTWPNPGEAYEEPLLRAAIKQLALGVRALHNAGKVHRDLKPHNVLVTPEGRVVILDFGIAREVAPTLAQLTAEAGFLGTLTYMAPEQARGEAATPASDWYAIGVMLFEALTGHLPFTGALSKVMSDKLQKTAPSPADRIQGLPEDLVELCEDLLEREAVHRPSADEILERLGGVDTALPDQSYLRIDTLGDEPLESRRAHLATLEEAFRKTCDGQAVSVYVHGSPGMGKTAIVHAFLKRLIDTAQAVVLLGRCHARELVPYKALDGVIDSLSKYLLSLPRHEVEVLLPREIQALARLFPVLSRVDAIAGAPHKGRGVVDQLPLRRFAFAALRDLLRRMTERQPVVLYIDDLQWADADSAALLGDLLRPPDPPPLLLVICFRSEEITSRAFLGDLVASAVGDTSIEITVEPLSDRDATQLGRALLGPQAGLESLLKTIVREARGNPFLIEQLVGYLKTNTSDLAQTGIDTRINLAEMLTTRMRHLPAGAEDLLLTLAAAGRPIDATVACQAAELEVETRPLVAALRAARLIRSSGSADAI
ncbi:MAG: protein kinase, partial [Acidobacteriota bacterium]